MNKKPIGKVVHWYDKIGVAVLDLKGALKVGDTIKVQKGDEEFDEEIESMQIEHKSVKSAKKGDEVAIKLSKTAKDGALIYKV